MIDPLHRQEEAQAGDSPLQVTGAEAQVSLALDHHPPELWVSRFLLTCSALPSEGMAGTGASLGSFAGAISCKALCHSRVIELVGVNLNLLWPSCHHEETEVYTTKE